MYKSSRNTLTGNWINHAIAKNSASFQKGVGFGTGSTENPAKIVGWLQKVKDTTAASSEYEFNRDLTVIVCRDLQPFSAVE